MFTDLVGYSSITSADEKQALSLLEEHRAVLEPVFEEHGGKVVKTMGDGFLVEFASAVEAVNCAVEVQTAIGKFNQRRGNDSQVRVRIGIHVGDIVHSEGDVLGDAVNIAARLEPLAEPGGIIVTKQVVDQVERKVDHRLVRIGPRELKNIGYKVELYKVEVPSAPSQFEVVPLDPRRVAILPLANLSADPNDRYFADGMTEELISTVSRIEELSVISRTSVMKFKDAGTSIGEIGRELSAGTVLEGSVRKAGNKVRITTQLIDARSDRHLWAQSYDRDLTDIFAIQGDIAEKVAEVLKAKLVPKQIQAIQKGPTGVPEAYTLYLKGRFYWNERSAAGIEKAVKYFKDAVNLDPNFALAYSGLADSYNIEIDRGRTSYAEGGLTAKNYAEKAVSIDPELAEAHASMALALHVGWDFAGSEREFKRSIELKPSYAIAHHWYWGLLLDMGRFEDGYETEKKAFELDPYSSVVRQGLGIALLYMGKSRDAILQFDKTIVTDPEFASAHYWKAWAHLELGEGDRAVDEMARFFVPSGGPESIRKITMAVTLARAGRKEEALREIEGLETQGRGKYVSPGLMAALEFDLGRSDEAFALLDRAFAEHDAYLLYFRMFPWYAEARSDSRWSEIERRLNESGVTRA